MVLILPVVTPTSAAPIKVCHTAELQKWQPSGRVLQDMGASMAYLGWEAHTHPRAALTQRLTLGKSLTHPRLLVCQRKELNYMIPKVPSRLNLLGAGDS